MSLARRLNPRIEEWKMENVPFLSYFPTIKNSDKTLPRTPKFGVLGRFCMSFLFIRVCSSEHLRTSWLNPSRVSKF